MPRKATALLIPPLALLASCSLFGDDATGIDDEDLARIHTMLDENASLTVQIVDAQHRLILDCVEQQGHTVHDRHAEVMWNFQKLALTSAESRAMPWLPDRAIAEEWGIGAWTSTADMYGSDEQLEFESLSGSVPSFALTDNSAFEALADEDQFDWYVAYFGRERAIVDHGHLIGEGGFGGAGGLLGSVEPAGCMGEITEALGLTPEFIPQPGFGEDVGTWSTFPRAPGSDVLDGSAFSDDLRAARTREQDLIDCLDNAGWGEWGFAADGSLNLRTFVDSAYYTAHSGGPDTFKEGVPESPSDVPADFASRRTWEIGFALDVHECVDETEFREDAVRAWNEVYGVHLLELESDIYAWQEAMRETIAHAQTLLGE
jgi:hypothetical protein